MYMYTLCYDIVVNIDTALLQVKSTALDSEETKAELKSFHDLVHLRYGPFGMYGLVPS